MPTFRSFSMCIEPNENRLGSVIRPLVLPIRSHEDPKFIIPWTGDRHLHALSDPDCAHLIIREPETTERLGFVMLFGLASCNRDIEFRRIVSIRKNQGIGRAALQAVKGFAFHT